MKKNRFKKQKPYQRTPQEQLVAHFSRHSISRGGTFHPTQWRSGKEPADMVILVGRALLFVNMTHSRAFFDELSSHNLKQAVDRIGEWQMGPQIRGANEWRQFAINWDDVDDIAIVSVVDGPHAACTYHDLDQIGRPPKVRICATLTSKVMHELAQRGGGSRDLIDFMKSMRGEGIVPESRALQKLIQRYDDLVHQSRLPATAEPPPSSRAILKGKVVSFFDEYLFKFISMRGVTDEAVSGPFSDLAWADIFPAIAFITASVAEMGPDPRGQIRATIFGSLSPFQVIVSSNIKGLIAINNDLMETAKENGCTFFYTINLSPFGRVESFAVLPNDIGGATSTALREAGG